MQTHEIKNGCEYVVGDASEVLEEYREAAAVTFLDDAWASPQRVKRLEAIYDTHPFNERIGSQNDSAPDESTSVEILDACYDSLTEGGWLVSDAQDWVAPHLLNYLVRKWGDASQSHENYEGGGYRKLGGVTFLCENGEPSDQTKGTFLTRGGYLVIFAHKGPTDRKTDVPARQLVRQKCIQNDKYDWMSIKPIEPYVNWIEGLVDPGELILVPCAGTAPAALAAERVFGDDARYVCIDNNEQAFEAFKRRRENEL
ncbi:hypothetical protein [Natrinema ejinorense]|uniref:Methyltransferase n=1 Tax=Natrinema ejinorense TaxID=373386 RepID=A0A2A5QTT5_9EURY|nr:hypothetical protein [Natrinema ejinorense]PCR90240.1 hypothetical protein CP557_06600 [Natrinema ejinorense]